MINIIVCVKQVLNPEMPPGKFRIAPDTNKVLPPEGIPPVMSPFDEQAVEAALRVKEKNEAKITLISIGGKTAVDVIKHGLAMGADEGVLLQDTVFDGGDSVSTAYVLTQAIKKLGKYDLVLCGRQAADWDQGQVGSLIAENLGIPPVTFAKKIEAGAGKLRIERVILDGHEVAEVAMPAVVTVSNEIGTPRLPAGRNIMLAARKVVPTWTAKDIGADPALTGAAGARTKLLKLFIPVREAKCEMISGENAAEAGTKLADRLRTAKLI